MHHSEALHVSPLFAPELKSGTKEPIFKGLIPREHAIFYPKPYDHQQDKTMRIIKAWTDGISAISYVQCVFHFSINIHYPSVKYTLPQNPQIWILNIIKLRIHNFIPIYPTQLSPQIKESKLAIPDAEKHTLHALTKKCFCKSTEKESKKHL